MSADPLGASGARAAGPGGNLALGRVVTSVEYDIVGERDGRFAQRRAGVTSLEDVRADVASFAWVNPDITWHVIARTTTTAETLADHLLAPPATESGHQLKPDLTPDLSAPSPPPRPRRRRRP